MKKNYSTKLLILTMIALLLSGCGFHLRGQLDLPPQLQEMTVSGHDDYSELVVALKQQLEAAGITLSEEAPITLFIVKEEDDKQRVSVSKTVYFDEYQLISRATFELRDRAATALTLPETVTSQVVYQDDASNPASKSNEENILRRELQTSLALQILRRVTAINPDTFSSSNSANTTTSSTINNTDDKANNTDQTKAAAGN